MIGCGKEGKRKKEQTSSIASKFLKSDSSLMSTSLRVGVFDSIPVNYSAVLKKDELREILNEKFMKAKRLGELEFATDTTYKELRIESYQFEMGYQFLIVSGITLPSEAGFYFWGICDIETSCNFRFSSDLQLIKIIPVRYEIDQDVKVFGNILNHTFQNSNEINIELASLD